MFSHLDHDEQPMGRDDRGLIADNLQRIKDSIYGNHDEGPASPPRDRDD